MTRSDPTNAQPSTYTYPDELRVDEFVMRSPREDDVEAIAPAFQDPDVGGEAGLPPFDTETLRTVMRDQLPELRTQGILAPYVIEEVATGKIVGGFTLHHFDSFRDAVEVGYWLFTDARGRGIVARVLEAAIQHAFAHGIYRIEAHVRIGNTESERVLERAGFVREGVKRRFLRHLDEERRYDSTAFARLADD
jgi:RimJ/RimL family protein N-acetyltransferase